MEAKLIGAKAEKAAAVLLNSSGAAGWGRLDETSLKAAAVLLNSSGEVGWGRLDETSVTVSSLGMTSFSAVCSLRNQMLTKEAKQAHWKLDKQGTRILRQVRLNGVVKASKQINLPPLKVLSFVLQNEHGITNGEAQVALNAPDVHLTGFMLKQFRAARQADSVTKTLGQEDSTKAHPLAFE